MNELNPVDVFERLWDNGSSPDLDSFLTAAGAVDTAQLSRLARIDQGERWHRGDRRSAEEYLERYPALQADHDSAVDLIYHEYLLREKLAERPPLEEFTNRFPQHASALAEQVGFHRAFAQAAVNDSADSAPITETVPAPQSVNPLLPKLPAQFGRYRVLELLGRGAMGNVYLADDTQLGRQVALKLPRLDRKESPEAFSRFRREARIAATFHHPNLCPVYDFGELEGTLYLTMPCMTGQSLATKLLAGPMPGKEAVEIALAIARAMSVAHRAGVVHRDLKPSNILMCEDGEPVVMDFGLARRDLDLDPKLTGSGALVGTLAYMAPEQLGSNGDEVSPASDVYSLGVILYEMLSGRPPFAGSWQEVWEQIRSQPPIAPSEHIPALSPGLDWICLRALAKDPHHRFESMDALADALGQFVEQDGLAVIDHSMVKSRVDRHQPVEGQRTDLPSIPKQLQSPSRGELVTAPARPRRFTIVAVAAAAIVAVAGLIAWRTANISWATRQVPVIETLARAGRSFDAYDLTVRVRKYLRDDRRLNQMMPAIADSLSVTSEPSGAGVYLKRFVPGSASPPPTLVGHTPISDLEVARGSYVVSVQKEGFDRFQRTWSNVVSGTVELPIQPAPIQIKATLTPAGTTPLGMVFIPGDKYRLVPWNRPPEVKLKLDDYWIDRCEVTNRDFKEFVDASGYENASFWTRPFVKGGRTLPREEARLELVDSTGRPGPRNWSGGNFPEGKGAHPVSNITWYEAAAYAAFRGKSLPTLFQWEMAARHGANTNGLGVTMPWGMQERSLAGRANLGTLGTLPVGRMEFGMSPFGCFDMAGNVAEWCLNETSRGFIAGGGSWASLPQSWCTFADYPTFHSSAEIGFRCVLCSTGSSADQGSMRIDLDDEVPKFNPAPEVEVRTRFSHYEYDQKAPLDATVEFQESDEWRSERITYNGADGKRALAYLFVPKHFQGPHQVIHLFPAGDVTRRIYTVPQSIENLYASFIRSGRAMFVVVLEGFLEREGEIPAWFRDDLDPASIEFVEAYARHMIEMQRGLDYLLSRDDVDSDRVAFFGASYGGPFLVLPAIESRYKAVVLVSAGIGDQAAQIHEAARPIDFVPLIQGPTLLVHGLYDEWSSLPTSAQPLYDLLTGQKRLKTYKGAHWPSQEELVSPVNTFLDETFGPVKPVRSKELAAAP
jgi:formylglycine-generating enzyme required for sulfatase activity/cephalosporin-C deacetylase-like acetyl esterase